MMKCSTVHKTGGGKRCISTRCAGLCGAQAQEMQADQVDSRINAFDSMIVTVDAMEANNVCLCTKCCLRLYGKWHTDIDTGLSATRSNKPVCDRCSTKTSVKLSTPLLAQNHDGGVLLMETNGTLVMHNNFCNLLPFM